MRSIPFSKRDNRGLQECGPKASGPQICIMQNRNSVHFWVLAKSFTQKHDLRGRALDATLESTSRASSHKIDKVGKVDRCCKSATPKSLETRSQRCCKSATPKSIETRPQRCCKSATPKSIETRLQRCCKSATPKSLETRPQRAKTFFHRE